MIRIWGFGGTTSLQTKNGWAAKYTNLKDYDSCFFRKINGQSFKTNDEFIAARATLKPGDAVTFTLGVPPVHYFCFVI